MDIGIKTSDSDFTLRAAALIINDKKLPVDELGNTDIVPGFLKTALTNIPEEVVHIISKE